MARDTGDDREQDVMTPKVIEDVEFEIEEFDPEQDTAPEGSEHDCAGEDGS